MNQCIFSGRLTKDPIVRYTSGADSLAVVSFAIAVDRGKKKNGEEAGVDYINCKVFGKSGENLARFVAKGVGLSVIGHMQSGSYEKDGKKVYTLECIVDRWEFPLVNLRRDEAKLSADKQDRADLENINAALAGDEIPEGFQKLEDGDIPF